MRDSIKSFAGDALIYGATTMIGRLLNWLLMPFYIRVLTTSDYGLIVNIYSIISVLLVIFVYGLETSFFRFSKPGSREDVFKTTILFLGVSSTSILFGSLLLDNQINQLLFSGKMPGIVFLVGVIVALDAFLAIPFANLRLLNKSVRFSIIKLSGIFFNILFNILFLVVFPALVENESTGHSYLKFFTNENAVLLILLSNVLSSLIMFLFFLNDISFTRGRFNYSIFGELARYSWPILVVGITGMVTQNIDKILMPFLISSDGLHQLAIYGANFKIGVIMSLFTQSFRLAFEPFFFKNREKGLRDYAVLMDYFIFFGVLIFLLVMLFIDIINLLLLPGYIEGNIVIPYVLLAHLFFGIYFNLSLWYKLNDQTIIGSYIGFGGMIATVALNIFLVPLIGILGGAISLFCAYFVITIVSFFMGKSRYPVPYNLTNVFLYFVTGLLLVIADHLVVIICPVGSYIFKIVLLLIFVLLFLLLRRRDLKFSGDAEN